MEKSGKSRTICLNERHPALHTNYKNDKFRTKSGVAKRFAKIARFNTEVKVQMKLDREKAKKIITKSRNTKRRLKAKESGIRTAEEEKDASQLADYADQLLYDEFLLNEERKELGYHMVHFNHWDDWENILALKMGE